MIVLPALVSLLAQTEGPPLRPDEAGPTKWIRLLPDSAARQATQIDTMSLVFLVVSIGVLLLLLVLGGWFCIRYRAGSPASRRDQLQKTWPLEVTWTAISTVVFLGGFFWAGALYFDLYQPPPDALRIHVVGKQWMWKVQHPSGQREIDELHVPAGRKIELVLTSQDVIHSLWVPAFRVKRDVLPDRYTTLWFDATTTGRFRLMCAEFCGTDHSTMTGWVHVMAPADYERWLGPSSPEAPLPDRPGGPAAPLAVAGRGHFFRLGCNACHTPTARMRAPRLDGIWGRPVALRNNHDVVADDDYIRESILDPNAKIVAGYPAPSLMPTYRGQLSEDELSQLVEFIRSLRGGWWEAPSYPAAAVREEEDR